MVVVVVMGGVSAVVVVVVMGGVSAVVVVVVVVVGGVSAVVAACFTCVTTLQIFIEYQPHSPKPPPPQPQSDVPTCLSIYQHIKRDKLR